jgi:hypothetical protein
MAALRPPELNMACPMPTLTCGERRRVDGPRRASLVHLRCAAALVALTVVLWANHARAYCSEVTENPPPNYDPAKSGCFTTDPDAGRTLPTLFWRNQCTGYSLQRNASTQVSLDVAEQVAAKAFATWTAASCADGPPSIFASEQPPVDCSTVPSQQHNNPIIFRDGTWPYDDSVNALGFTKLTVDTVTGEIYGADIEINSTKILVANPPAPQGAYDLASILTHEAGHFLGLAHSADTTAVMYAFYHPGSTTLALDDIAGICATYPPDGTRATANGPLAATACDPSPRLGFSTSCDGTDGGVDDSDGAVADDGGGAGGDGGDPGSCPGLFSCALGNGRACGGGGLGGACGVAFLAALARRARRVSRRQPGFRFARTFTFGAMATLVGLGASALGARTARASVSITVLFEELVERASTVAIVVPTEQHSLWEGDGIVTYTRVRVDRTIAGRVAGDVWVRTVGGTVGHIAQILEGEATFTQGRSSLVFLRPHLDPVTRAPTGALSVVERAQGQFPVEPDGEGGARLRPAPDIGALVQPPAGTRDRGPPRLAREVLVGRPPDEAAHAIVAAWRKIHPGDSTKL